MPGPSVPLETNRLSIYEGPDDRPRHATWLELFFDLVFVVALVRLGSTLHHRLMPAGFVEFPTLFLLLWWLGFSYFADLFGAEGPLSKLTFLAAMAAVLYVFYATPGATGEGSFAFAVGTLALRLLLTASFFRARQLASERPYIALDALTTFVWGLSLLVPPRARIGLWVAATLVNTVGIAVVHPVTDETAAQTSHFPERLGLFTTIVLGETIIATSFGSPFPSSTSRPSSPLAPGSRSASPPGGSTSGGTTRTSSTGHCRRRVPSARSRDSAASCTSSAPVASTPASSRSVRASVRSSSLPATATARSSS